MSPDRDVLGLVADRVNMRTDKLLYISKCGKRRWAGVGHKGLSHREIAKGVWNGCRVEAWRGTDFSSRRLISSRTIEVWKSETPYEWRGEIRKDGTP